MGKKAAIGVIIMLISLFVIGYNIWTYMKEGEQLKQAKIDAKNAFLEVQRAYDDCVAVSSVQECETHITPETKAKINR